VFYAGGIQLDRHGNSNLIGTVDGERRFGFRGPGGIGTCNATVQNARFHLVTNTHSPRVLVERCDYISALGYGDGTAGFRERHGLGPDGPASIITPLCVFDFDSDTRAAKLKSVHPGTTVDDVRRATGFALDVDPDVAATVAPTDEQLRLLRQRIDVEGSLR
jgi:glutaconate CoA-transferase subunit B